MSSAYFASSPLAGVISLIAQARSPGERLESLQRLVSEARAEIEGMEAAPPVFTAELEHPRHGIYKIGVDPETLDGTTGSLLDISLALLTSAARIAAGRSIDPRSFDTPDEHEDAIARRAASFQIIGIRHSDDASRWLAKGTTSLGDAFETYVHAVDEQEADFQARWHAATLKNRAPIELETLPAFLGSLYEVNVDLVEPRPVDLLELAAASTNLVDHLRQIPAADWRAQVLSSEPFVILSDMLSKIVKAGLTAPTVSQGAAPDVVDTTVTADPVAPAQEALGAHAGTTEEILAEADGDPDYRQSVSIDLP